FILNFSRELLIRAGCSSGDVAGTLRRLTILLSPTTTGSQKGIEIKRRIPSMLSAHPPKTWTLMRKTAFTAKLYRAQQYQSLCCLPPQICLVTAKSFKDLIVEAGQPQK